MTLNILWLTTNLRLHDNKALLEAAKDCDRLLIVYCQSEWDSIASNARQLFLKEALLNLSQSLKALGQSLVASDLPAKETFGKLLPGLTERFQVRVRYQPAFNFRDQEQQSQVRQQFPNVEFLPTGTPTLLDPTALPEGALPPTGFTPFRRKVERFWSVPEPLPSPEKLPAPPELDWNFQNFLSSAPANGDHRFPGGESAALDRLKHYTWDSKAVSHYKETRNGMIAFDDSSKLSPWLAMGCLSPRMVYSEVKRYESQIERNESTYWLIFELLWRDFFKFYSHHHGENLFEFSGPRQVRPETASSTLQDTRYDQWSKGETTSDFVNANMRELNATGWMSNRGRQNVASYLCKTLLVDWRKGADWFARHLLDFDVESNWGNWTYLAGTGADPRDRKFDVEKQAGMYDPDGAYRKLFHK